jgi:hypothetical protein
MNTHQVINLIILGKEGQLVTLLVLDESLNVHVEGLAGRTLGGLRRQLALRSGRLLYFIAGFKFAEILTSKLALTLNRRVHFKHFSYIVLVNLGYSN